MGKLKISSIKLKSQAGPSKVLELFNEVQYLTVKVRAHGGDNSLRYDEEYVTLLLKHLSEEQQDKWVDLEDNSWDAFYNFLEKLAIQARKKVSIQDTLKAMGARVNEDKTTGDKKLCTTCGRIHRGSCYKEKVVATTAEVKKPVGKRAFGGPRDKVKSSKSFTCLICNQSQHQKTGSFGEKKSDRALASCPRWNKSSSAEKVK